MGSRSTKDFANLDFAPDRRWKLRVITVPGNYMPVKVGYQIAKTGEVDFLGRIKLAQCRLSGENNGHQVVSVGTLEVSHLANMGFPDDAAESRIINSFGAVNPDYTTPQVFPQRLPSSFRAETTTLTCAKRISFRMTGRAWSQDCLDVAVRSIAQTSGAT